jgi:hypothetical protein
VLGTALVVAVVGGLALRAALQAEDLAREAKAELASARTAPDDLTAEQAGTRVRAAAEQLERAQQALARPAPRVVAALPLVGRSLVAEQRVVDAAAAVVEALEVAVAAAPELSADGGGLAVDRLRGLGGDLAAPVADAERALERLAAVRTGWTPPTVGRNVRTALADLGPAVDGLRGAADGASALAWVLGSEGPRSVLVTLQNNAELRGTGGYVSTFATGVAQDGRLELGPFRDVIEVSEPPEQARRVPSSPEYREDYGPFLADTTLWRLWNMSPHVPDSAAVAAEVGAVLLDDRPDVVLLLDVVALAALASLDGRPLVLPDGTEVEGERLVDELLVDAYADAGEDEAEQSVRRTELRAAAGNAATRLLDDAGIDAVAAAREVLPLLRGRHLTAWAADPEVQQQLVAAGAAGEVVAGEDDLVHVSVNNLTANKLDYYVHRSVSHTARLHDGRAEVVQRVVLENRAPDGLVPYVTGTGRPGTSDERVELSVPPRAVVRSFTAGGAPVRGDIRVGEQRTRAITYVTLGPRERVELELRYDLPLDDGAYRVRLVPQPLARAADLTVAVRAPAGERLVLPEGFGRDGDVVTRTGPWETTHVVELPVDRPEGWSGLRRAVREFWQEPVTLGSFVPGGSASGRSPAVVSVW